MSREDTVQSPKLRNYVFTIFCENYKNVPEKLPVGIKYLVCQQEKCPSTGKLHLQGYLELTKPMRMSAVKKLLDCPSVHLEVRKGTQEQAIAYCKKTESRVAGPWEFGEPGRQGKRVDLECLQSLSFMKLSDWVIENPVIALKYPNGVKLIKQSYDLKQNSTKQRDIDVNVLIGPSGCGKTKFVFDNHNADDVYQLNTNTNGTLWFDGYEGQKVLVIDDFKGWIKYTELLKILDRYPYRCQLKGSYCYAAWTTIYITSNHVINEWYDFDENRNLHKPALLRRITKFIDLSKSSQVVEQLETSDSDDDMGMSQFSSSPSDDELVERPRHSLFK